MQSPDFRSVYGRVDVLGDIAVDLDEEFQVTAVWNIFDHMDLKRASLYDATCKIGPGSGRDDISAQKY